VTKEAGEEYKGHPTGDGNRGGFKSSRSTGLRSEAGPAGKIRERRSCPARDKLTLIPPNGRLLRRGGVVAEMRYTGVIELDLRKGIRQGSAKSETFQWCS
jgi:hypothetical protein